MASSTSQPSSFSCPRPGCLPRQRSLEDPLLAHKKTPFNDHVFTETFWDKHRNSLWRHRFEPIIFFKAIAAFTIHLICIFIIAVCTGLYDSYLVPEGWPEIPQATEAFNMLTFALSLLMVFRTNSSYSRWWEGRTIVGKVVNLVRNYTRLVLMYAQDEEKYIGRDAATWAAASLHVLRGHIRQLGPDAYLEARHLLDDHQLMFLSAWKNPCMGVARGMSDVIERLTVHPQIKAMMEEQVSLYVSMVGGCERIYKTPLPAAYTRHTSRFLMLYLFIMPVVLWPTAGWATVPLSVLIACMLLGTENIGVQIEEPFYVLPLLNICNKVQGSVLEILDDFESNTVPSLRFEGQGLQLRTSLGGAYAGQDVDKCERSFFGPLSRPHSPRASSATRYEGMDKDISSYGLLVDVPSSNNLSRLGR